VVVRNGYLPEREVLSAIGPVPVMIGLRAHAIARARGRGFAARWYRRTCAADTRDQRCWVRKTANVLDYPPKSVRAKAKSMPHEISMAENRANAEAAFDRFIATFQAKYPRATECLAKDRKAPLAFYDFPAEHWIHIRTSNPIESTFGTVRHRTDRTKGRVSRSSLLGLTYKLAMSAQKSWNRLRGLERLGELVAGAKFVDGVRAQPRTKQNRSVQQAAA